MSAWKFDGSMIETLESELNAYEALMELFDNAIDAEATRIEIVISSRLLTFTDNGRGCIDLNVMAQPYRSESKKSATAIGLRGVGGTRAMATFGREQIIESVSRDDKLYRRYKVRWNPDGDLPSPYNGIGTASNIAPPEIKDGGTKITVTQRQEGLHYDFNRICRELQKAYRPALNSNLIVTIKGPEDRFSRQLSNPAIDSNKFTAPIQTLSGVARGKTFTVRYSVLKKEDATLRGCHVIFGPRVMFDKSSVGKISLPPSCYMDVTLGPDWKKTLGSRKSQIRYDDALDKALERLLQEWLKKLREDAASIRLDLLLGIAAANINQELAFLDKLSEGEYGPKTRKTIERSERPISRRELNPDRIITPRRTRASIGTANFAAQSDQAGCLKLDLKSSTALGRNLYSISYTPSAGIVTVYINCAAEQSFFQKARNTDGKSWTERGQAEAQRVGYFAYAEAAADPGMRKESVPLFTALRKLGYDIDESSPQHDIRHMVLNFFYDQLGAGKLKVIDGAAA